MIGLKTVVTLKIPFGSTMYINETSLKSIRELRWAFCGNFLHFLSLSDFFKLKLSKETKRFYLISWKSARVTPCQENPKRILGYSVVL